MMVVVVMSGCGPIAITAVARLFHGLLHLVCVLVLGVVLVQRLEARPRQCERGSNQQREQS